MLHDHYNRTVACGYGAGLQPENLMIQFVSVSCKLKVSRPQAAKLDATLEAFGQALNWVNQNTPEKVTSAVKLQFLCYREIRSRFGLSSNLAVQVCRRVAGARKAARDLMVKEFKRRFVAYDVHLFSFREKDWTVSLTTLAGRERFELSIGNYQRKMLAGSHPRSATLVKRKDGSYYIQICVKKQVPKQQDTDKVIGVDLGLTDIAYTSEGDKWDGQQLSRVREHHFRLRAALQRKASKGTRSSRRRCRQLLQRLSGKERRFQTWVNHRISKAIVSRAKATNSAIALEDLTGIRERVNHQIRSKAERRRINTWAFYQLRQFLEYKARVAGIPLILVSPAYTSQTCHRCLHIHPDPARSYRNGKSFKCGHCGWEGDADFNGANVIALLGAVANQPRGPGLFCSLVEQNRLRATESPPCTA
jgi:IS605 OrfB family transposase